MNDVREIGAGSTPGFGDLEELVRKGCQGFLQDLLEDEVASFLGRLHYQRREKEVRGYRNGHGKVRRLSMMTGTVEIRRPRVRDCDERFESRLLPLFKRRSESIANLLPDLYLHGLSHGDFELALRGLLGEGAPLSSASLARLKAKWSLEYEQWGSRDLSGLEIVYWWVDGVYVKAGVGDTKLALLVVIGAGTDGKKHLLAVESGYRESKESWSCVLRSLFLRKLGKPLLVVGDGNLGTWAALEEQCPEAEQQRCWNHRIVNILDAVPKKYEAEARELLTQLPYSDTRQECEEGKKAFIRKFSKIAPKACEKIETDWDRMVTFFNYPKEHWVHLRTTNVIESPFSTLRLRTGASRRYKKVENAVALLWKLLTVYEKRFRKLKGWSLLGGLLRGDRYHDGVRIEETKSQAA